MMLKISAVFVVLAAAATAGGALLKSEKLGLDLCCILEKPAGRSSSAGSEIPLACSLTAKEDRDRRAEVSKLLSGASLGLKELETGYAIEFKAGHGREIVEFIELEGECCPFFNFALEFKPKGGPVVLTISGPEGSKQFLADFLKPFQK